MLFSIRTPAVIILFAAIAFSPEAYASKTVTSPYVTQGEKSLEWKGEYIVDDDNDREGAWKQKAVVGYGITSFWSSEIEANVEQGGGSDDDTKFANIDWKNKFQLLPPGQYWVDAGMRLTYSFNTTGGADEVEGKLLFGKDLKNTRHSANLIASTEVGEDSSDEVDWGLSWSSRYKYSDGFQPGFELHSAFGEIGNEGEFDDQDHRLGPVFYGKFGKGFSYDAGYLFGISDRAPDGTVKAIVKYKW